MGDRLGPLNDVLIALTARQIGAAVVTSKTRDDQAKAEFEMYANADYARLNEERRELVQGIQERGLVYG